MPLVCQLFENAKRLSRKTAWIDVDERGMKTQRSWSDIAEEVVRMASALQLRGVASGERVAVVSENRREAVSCVYALSLLGAVAVMLDVRNSAAQIRELMAKVTPSHAVTSRVQQGLLIEPPDGARICILETLADGGEGASHMRPASIDDAISRSASISNDQDECILFTSGTTSDAKAVVLTHGNLHQNAMAKLNAVPQTRKDRRLMLLPMTHAYARTCDIGTWILSGSVLCAGSGWQAIELLAPSVRPTLINCVPYIAEKLGRELSDNSEPRGVLAKRGLDKLKLLGCGGAALTSDLFERYRSLGITVIQGYGLTETSPVICSATPEDASPGVVGRPVQGVRVRIDHDGQVLCQGPNIARTYHGDSEGFASRTHNGWFQTGDLGEFDAQGRLRILGRRDDAIVLSTGRKVNPLAIENQLRQTGYFRHLVLAGAGKPFLIAVASFEETLPEREALQISNTVLAEFADHQRPRAFVRIPESVLADSSLFTAKGTIKRRQLLARCELQIAEAFRAGGAL